MIFDTKQSTLIYDSAKRGHPAIEELRQIFQYRYLITQLVRRDILTRYKRSVLGIAWTLLNPLGMMVVLTLAFSQIFRFGDIKSYPAYVLSGILSWTFFSQVTTAAMVNLIWGGGILHRIYLPRTSFALSAVGTGLVNIALSTIPLLLILLVTGVPLKLTLLWMPLPILLLACFSLGVGLMLSTLAAFFPDVSEMYQIILTAWMYLTPIIYPEEILPQNIRFLITTFNPVHYFVKLYRLSVYFGRAPTTSEVLIPTGIALGFLIIGWLIFTKKADEFAYRI
ncbi:MAG: ABC transporter permease [Anaerolineaceae bacterium]|jgi:ABC-type polysaccharide/polyol phosphate export permease